MVSAVAGARGDAVGQVVVVTSDTGWVAALERHLMADGFDVEVVSSLDFDAALADTSSAIIVADTGPSGAVADVAAAIRRASHALLMIAGPDEADVVDAVAAGADGYVCRGASIEIVTARLRAMIRRGHRVDPRPPARVPGTVRPPRPPVPAAAIEGAAGLLLQTLTRRAGKVVTRRELMNELNVPHAHRVVLDGAIRRLRRQIIELDLPASIVTIRGVGYRFDCDADGTPAGPTSDSAQAFT